MVLIVSIACGEPKKSDEIPVVIVPEKTGKAIAVTLPEGTSFAVSLINPIGSASDKIGGTATAFVSGDVKDPSGRVAIPSGAMLTLKIDDIDGATTVRPQGEIKLSPQSVNFQRQDVALKARVDSIPRRLIDRVLLVERSTQLTVTLTAPLQVSVIP